MTTPVLVAILATIGGLIKPMQQRWQNWLSTAEEETAKIQQQAKQAPSVQAQAQQARDRYNAAD